MKILFSPSEGKKTGGDERPFSKESFIFPELYEQRLVALDAYNAFVSSVSDEQLSKLLGIKNHQHIETYRVDIYKQPTMKAIMRYDGVAFNYLDYTSLPAAAQSYIDNNTIIFSNLFGPILAGDIGLPEYKLKQGEKIGSFTPETFYKKHFTAVLDELLENEPYLDLRAGFYNKFYKPSSPYVTLKFIKNSKVVSHWAKAYRGIVLRNIALNNIQEMEQFMKMEIKDLSLCEILRKGKHTELVYDIIS